MANMFSNREKIVVPKSLGECTKQDSLSVNLWSWARRLETLAKVLCAIIIVAGLYISIKESTQLKEAADIYASYASKKEISDYSSKLFFSEFFQYLITGTLTFFAFHAIALLIGALASIVQNTRISANVALLSARNKIYQSNTINSPQSEDLDGEQTESSEAFSEKNSLTVLNPKKYTIIRRWNNKMLDNDVEKTCAFCKCKKKCSFMLTKNNEGTKELLWLCDDCIEKYSNPE